MFRRTMRVPNSPCVYVIYYMLDSGSFAATCLQDIVKGGSSILGRPGKACDVSGFNNSSTCSNSDDSGGAAAPRSTRTPRSSGYDVYAHVVYVVICYMSIICYMPVICLVQSPPQEAVVVFGYIEGPFLVSTTGCARECHAPCIEGPFLVSTTGHARERHAP